MLVLNIYKNERLIGQDYLRHDGTWGHKWYSNKNEGFERGGWRGRAKGEDDIDWIYKVVQLCELENER